MVGISPRARARKGISSCVFELKALVRVNRALPTVCHVDGPEGMVVRSGYSRAPRTLAARFSLLTTRVMNARMVAESRPTEMWVYAMNVLPEGPSSGQRRMYPPPPPSPPRMGWL